MKELVKPVVWMVVGSRENKTRRSYVNFKFWVTGFSTQFWTRANCPRPSSQSSSRLQTAFRTIWERLSSGPPHFVRANLKLEPFSDEKGHLLAVFWFRILVRNLEFVRFNNLKVTQWDHTIACDNRENRRHFMEPVLFVVRPFLYGFARLV